MGFITNEIFLTTKYFQTMVDGSPIEPPPAIAYNTKNMQLVFDNHHMEYCPMSSDLRNV